MAFGLFARAVITSSAALALIAGSGAGVAAAESGETFTFPTPDVEHLQPGCVTHLTTSPSLVAVVRNAAESQADAGFERIDLSETGWMQVESKGCGPVSWQPGVWISDTPVGSGTWRVVGATGSSGNPARASAAQTVTYGVGEREAADITLTYFAKSRLGEVCMTDKWTFDVATKTPSRIARSACAIDPTLLYGSS